MYQVKVKFEAFSDDGEWSRLKGFEYKWTGEIADPADMLDDVRELVSEHANAHIMPPWWNLRDAADVLDDDEDLIPVAE